MRGTITTTSPVMKAAREAVVYISPVVCNWYPSPRNTPAAAPSFKSTGLSRRRLGRLIAASAANASVMRSRLKIIGEVSARAALTSEKVVPQTTATPSRRRCAANRCELRNFLAGPEIMVWRAPMEQDMPSGSLSSYAELVCEEETSRQGVYSSVLGAPSCLPISLGGEGILPSQAASVEQQQQHPAKGQVPPGRIVALVEGMDAPS